MSTVSSLRIFYVKVVLVTSLKLRTLVLVRSRTITLQNVCSSTEGAYILYDAANLTVRNIM